MDRIWYKKFKMKKKRQIFIVDFVIHYNSGATYKNNKEVLSITDNGAIDIVQWLFKAKNMDIISVKPTFKYIGEPIIPDYKVLGDY